MKKIIYSISVVALALSAGLPAQAQDSVTSFYKGKTITIITPFPPGGSYDRYSRMAARYMGKYIPGHPAIIVKNKSGVAGTMRDFAENSVDDGTAMGIFPETIAIEQKTNPSMAPWDVGKLVYIGSFSDANTGFYLRKGAPAKGVEDFRKVQTNIGCNSPIGQSCVYPKLLKKYLGYKFNVIAGYKGQAPMRLALRRGEIDLTSGNWAGWRNRAGIKDGTFKVVIQGGLTRLKDLANVPLMQDLVTDPTEKKIIEFWSSGAPIGRALVLRKSVPKDRIDALRAAFDKMVKDPDLLKDAAKTKTPIEPKSGVEVQRISDGILNTPKKLLDLAEQAIQ